MQKTAIKYLFQRERTFYFRRVIPNARRLDFTKPGSKIKREWVHSLDTKSLTEALPLLAEYTERTDCLLAGTPKSSGVISIAHVRERVKQLGGVYRHVDTSTAAPVEESVDMSGPLLEAYEQMPNPDPITIAAVGGVVQAPAMTMWQAWLEYEKHYEAEWSQKTARQQSKVRNKHTNAVREFETLMGDSLDILKITKREVYDFRNKLLARIKSKQPKDGEPVDDTWKVDTVRKKIMWVRLIVRFVYELEGRDDSPFENLRPIKGIGDEEKRKPILESEVLKIRKHYAEVGANDELVAIMAVIENTGIHAAEICYVTEEDICLNEPIPYLAIRPNENRSMLKTDNRIRMVPLVGIALEAMKRFPKGFPRYCLANGNGADNLSAAANKLIQAIAADKTTYGYRHRMADLMKKHRIEDTMKDGIMGHDSQMTGYYGTEYPLSEKLKVLKQVLPEYAY